MFIAIIVLLGFAAVAVAKKAPGTIADRASLPPDMSKPSTGATDKFSPALTGGSALIAKDNRLRLGMTYQNAGNLIDRVRVLPLANNTLVGIRGGLTNAESSLMTQDVPPLATRIDSMPSGGVTQRRKL